MSIKILVVDDTIFYRKIISDVLKEMPGVEVIGVANNGEIAFSRIRSLKPDLLTLDIEMPEMNGLELLQKLNEEDISVDSIMLSSKTIKGGEATIQALELGALDFIPKPDSPSPDENIAIIKKELKRTIEAYKRKKQFRSPAIKAFSTKTDIKKPAVSPPRPIKKFSRTEKSHAIAIGISTGGPSALATLIPQLPSDIGVPIFLVQHIPPIFSASLADSLNKKSALTVKEATDGEVVVPNTVYIAPGGMHMAVATGTNFTKIIRTSKTAPPENNCRPSVDYLFRSIAKEYGSKATCVIMTGMGVDGRSGTVITRSSGAVSIAQSAETCTVYGMPKAVIEEGLADVIAPLDSIASEIIKTL